MLSMTACSSQQAAVNTMPTGSNKAAVTVVGEDWQLTKKTEYYGYSEDGNVAFGISGGKFTYVNLANDQLVAGSVSEEGALVTKKFEVSVAVKEGQLEVTVDGQATKLMATDINTYVEMTQIMTAKLSADAEIEKYEDTDLPTSASEETPGAETGILPEEPDVQPSEESPALIPEVPEEDGAGETDEFVSEGDVTGEIPAEEDGTQAEEPEQETVAEGFVPKVLADTDNWFILSHVFDEERDCHTVTLSVLSEETGLAVGDYKAEISRMGNSLPDGDAYQYSAELTSDDGNKLQVWWSEDTEDVSLRIVSGDVTVEKPLSPAN